MIINFDKTRSKRTSDSEMQLKFTNLGNLILHQIKTDTIFSNFDYAEFYGKLRNYKQICLFQNWNFYKRAVDFYETKAQTRIEN